MTSQGPFSDNAAGGSTEEVCASVAVGFFVMDGSGDGKEVQVGGGVQAGLRGCVGVKGVSARAEMEAGACEMYGPHPHRSNTSSILTNG